MVVLMKCDKKKLKPLGYLLGRYGLNSGPRAQADAQLVSAFFCRTSWIPPWFQDLLPKVFVNTIKTVQKINEYQVTKIKKYAGFLLKSSIGDIWDKNTAATVMTNKDLHIYILPSNWQPVILYQLLCSIKTCFAIPYFNSISDWVCVIF